METPHILFVDDDEDIIYIQQKILIHFGYEVSAFTNPLDALDYFRSNTERFDAAIIDFLMPKLKGDDLACKIKAIKPDLPVILCTGFGTDIAKEQVDALGLDGFLIKPITGRRMQDTLSSLIAKQGVTP